MQYAAKIAQASGRKIKLVNFHEGPRAAVEQTETKTPDIPAARIQPAAPPALPEAIQAARAQRKIKLLECEPQAASPDAFSAADEAPVSAYEEPATAHKVVFVEPHDVPQDAYEVEQPNNSTDEGREEPDCVAPAMDLSGYSLIEQEMIRHRLELQEKLRRRVYGE